MLKRSCHFFNTTGKCRFGKHCKFLHCIDISQPQLNSENQQDDILRSDSAANSTKEEVNQGSYLNDDKNKNEGLKKEKVAPRKVRPLCKSYSERRFCRYGNSCWYAHVLPGGEKVKDRNDLKDRVEDDKESPSDDVQNLLQDEEEKDKVVVNLEKDDVKKGQRQKKLCRYFSRGTCRSGRSCRFYHPKPHDEGIKEQPVPSTQNVAEGLQNDTNTEEWRPVVRPPKIINVYQRDSVSKEKAKEIRETEIKQLKRRFPSDKLKIVSETDEVATFIFTFMPTDPDWPFDVKTFDIQVAFGPEYPIKLFKILLPLEQDLPATVLRYIEVSLQEWVMKKEEDCVKKGIVEMLFRPFLRWMDRNMETIVTQGLKQLQRELRAQAAGLQFIPAKDLKKQTVTEPEGDSNISPDSSDMMVEKDNRRPVEYRKGDLAEEMYETPTNNSDEDRNSCDTSDEDDDAEGHDGANADAHTRPMIDPDTERSGTEVSLKNMQIWYLTTLLMEKLRIVVQCQRCKNKTDFSTPPNRVNSVACFKCSNAQLVVFRPLLAHAYSSIVGYLDLDGCTAFDVVLQDCHLSIGCIKCSRDALVKKFMPGKQTEVWCRGCHAKMKFSCDSVKLSLLTADGIDKTKFSGSVHTVNVRRNQRTLKDPAIREGFPLPNEGACRHYKKSFRWLRFPCCGKTYPCDVCHDSKEDHEMKYANRMICGFCCKEQPFAADKPCSGCGSSLTKVRTSHWEGGQGCRDKISMSRNDDKKYANINKTVSNKAKAAQEKNKGKKTTRLRHT